MLGIAGVTELGVVARQARLAGGQVLPRMRRELATVAKPAKAHVEAQITAKIPRRGGLSALLVRAVRVRARTDTGFTTAGVTIVTYADGKGARRDLPAINRGRVRHPVYGRRRTWVVQRVPEGFWDDAMDETSDDAHDRVRVVLDKTIRDLRGA